MITAPVMSGDIQLKDSVVSKLLGQGLDKYNALFPHVSAAIQLANEGKSSMVGEVAEWEIERLSCTNLQLKDIVAAAAEVQFVITRSLGSQTFSSC